MDSLIEMVGPFGRYQKFVSLALGSISALTSMTVFSTVFILANPKLICNQTLSNSLYEHNEETRCLAWHNVSKSRELNQTSIYECYFDDTFYSNTLVTELELICEKSFLRGLTQSVYLVGGFFSLSSGFISDKFGRKKTLFSLTLTVTCVYVVSELAQLKMFNLSMLSRYTIYTLGQFLIGCLQKSLYCVGFILLIEMTSLKYLTICSIYYLCMFVLGEFVILFVGYFLRDWHIINYFIIVYSFICLFILVLFVPESPRFLLTNNRKKEVLQLLCKIAKFNQIKINESDLDSSLNLILKINKDDTRTTFKEITSSSINTTTTTYETKTNKFKSLFTPFKSLMQTVSFVYIWFAVSLIYYGVSLGITDLDSLFNPYWIFFISSVAEIVGYISCKLNDIYGRKRMFMAYFLLIGVSCIVEAAFLSLPLKSKTNIQSDESLLNFKSIIKVAFAGLTKAAASAVFDSCYVYNSLFYSTDIRTTAVLFSANLGVVGSFLSPQVRFLGELFWRPLTFLIYALNAFVAIGVLCLLSDPSKMDFN